MAAGIILERYGDTFSSWYDEFTRKINLPYLNSPPSL